MDEKIHGPAGWMREDSCATLHFPNSFCYLTYQVLEYPPGFFPGDRNQRMILCRLYRTKYLVGMLCLDVCYCGPEHACVQLLN